MRAAEGVPQEAEAASQSARLRGVFAYFWSIAEPRPWAVAVALLGLSLNRLAGLVAPTSTKVLIDRVIVGNQHELLLPLVAVVIGATAFEGVTTFALTRALSNSAHHLVTNLRIRLCAHVARLPVAYFDKGSTGHVTSLIMSDVEAIQSILGTNLLSLFGNLLTAAFAIAVMLYINAILTIAALLALTALVACFSRGMRALRPISRERRRAFAELTARLVEQLGGIRVIKAFHAEQREHSSFASGATRLRDVAIRASKRRAALVLAGRIGFSFMSSVVLYGAARQAMVGRLTVGDLFMFMALVGYLVAPVADILDAGGHLGDALAGLERTRQAFGERREDIDPRRTVALCDLRGEIEFDAVSFAYDVGQPVLHDVCFQATAGSVTALVGPSGAGKSTIAGILAAFYTASSGRVLVDGVDISTALLSSYRTRIGIVLQDTFLFDGTIWENVAFSRPQASEAEIVAACDAAHVREFAERWPTGYHTPIGERGAALSGGQRQRIAIARAILFDPRILILDEATSSLDTASEHLVHEGLTRLMHGRTTVIIAHRLSTIRKADQILVLENGRIIERGSHASLYARRGRYHEMYTSRLETQYL